MLSALRGVLKTAWKLGLISAEDYQKAASVESIRDETLPSGCALSSSELVGLLNTCDATPLGTRDAAILSLLYGCGLRRAELVTLNMTDYKMEEKELIIRGKGNKQRAVPLGNAVLALTDWLTIRGQESGPLFWGLGNRNRGKRLTDQAVYNMLRKRAKQAGVKNLSPPNFRRTFVGDLLDAGADIVTVQKMAGHASPATISRYDRVTRKCVIRRLLYCTSLIKNGDCHQNEDDGIIIRSYLEPMCSLPTTAGDFIQIELALERG